MERLKIRMKAWKESHTKTVVESRNFRITIDEPPSLGGKDEGPNPVEYLAAALVGCLNITGHIVAREMGIKLEELNFSVEGEIDPRGFMGKGDVRPGFLSLRVKLEVKTDVDNETLKEWLRVVESRCPVSDNIKNETPVEIEVEKAP